MGNRLTQIATRTGDDGTTGLGDNTRVSKASGRPQAMISSAALAMVSDHNEATTPTSSADRQAVTSGTFPVMVTYRSMPASRIHASTSS